MANLILKSQMESTSQTFKAMSSGGDFPFCNNSRMISKRLLLDSISSFLNSQKKGWITSVNADAVNDYVISWRFFIWERCSEVSFKVKDGKIDVLDEELIFMKSN